MKFLRVLLLFATVVCCCCFEKGRTIQRCKSSSSPFKIAVGNKELCSFDPDIRNYSSINELDKVILNCTEVYLCSLSSITVPRTLLFRDLHDVSFVGLKDTTLHCSTNTSIQFTKVTNLTVRNLQFQNCSERFNMRISFKGNKTYPYWSGIVIFSCMNVSFKNVTVSGSKGIGLSVFNTDGRNVFERCIFKFNGKSNVRGGTGLKLEISNYNETAYREIENSFLHY